jgi:hypothetical protein
VKAAVSATQVLNIHNLYKRTKGELKITARRKARKEGKMGLNENSTKRKI